MSWVIMGNRVNFSICASCSERGALGNLSRQNGLQRVPETEIVGLHPTRKLAYGFKVACPLPILWRWQCAENPRVNRSDL